MKHAALLLMVCGCLAGCNRQPDTASAPADNWPAMRDALVEEFPKAHPAFAVVSGTARQQSTRGTYDPAYPTTRWGN